jgi:ankyrin repeat protein
VPSHISLPASPSLEQQRKRAKDLLKAARAGDSAALQRFARSHPRLGASPTLRDAVRLADAQWVIAREYGFTSWARLKAHVDALSGKAPLRRPFETDPQYYRDRAAGMLSVFATGEPNAIRLARLFHPSFTDAAEADIRAAELTQADAELILAREHGFETFEALARHVETLGEKPEPFRLAFEAIKADDRAKFSAQLRSDPDLVNAPGTNGNRLILLAMSFGRLAMVEDLLDAGADPDLPNNKGWTALHQAAYTQPPSDDPRPAVALLDRLLAAGASPYAEAYGDGGTPLAVSLFWGHVPLAQRLAAAAIAPCNLRVAAGLGRLDLMRALFEGGRLRPEAGLHREFHRPHSGFPPWRPTDVEAEILAEALTYAARSGRIEAMAFLLERGADIDAEPCNGTALHWAVARRRAEATAWLLERDADIDRRAAFGGTRGVTPLHIAAAWGGSPDCARLLVERGADRSIKDALQDGTPANWAAFFKNQEIREMIERA